MNEPMQNPYPPNVQDELAHERNHLAADRSLLSFIRISTTLISTGVGFDQVLRILFPTRVYIGAWTYTLSLVLVGLGVINLLFAALDYQGEMKRLQQPQYYFTPRWSLGSITGWTLFFTGLVAFFRL
jgi:uncharacterized membrane protein YidH (DUF202 family)